MKIKIRSKATGNLNEMDLPITLKDLQDWEVKSIDEKFPVSKTFPNMNSDQILFLLTGITPEEFKTHILEKGN